MIFVWVCVVVGMLLICIIHDFEDHSGDRHSIYHPVHGSIIIYMCPV